LPRNSGKNSFSLAKYFCGYISPHSPFSGSASTFLLPYGAIFAVSLTMNTASPSVVPLAVTRCAGDPTIAFAAEELVRYFGLMAGNDVVATVVDPSEASEVGGALEIGLFSYFGLDPF